MAKKFFVLGFCFVFGFVTWASAQLENDIESNPATDKTKKRIEFLKSQEEEQEEDALENLDLYCEEQFNITGKCPNKVCNIGCLGGVIYDGCEVSCAPKSCLELDVRYCPSDTCQVMESCSGYDICYFKSETSPPKCGGLAYSYQDVECCEGFEPRCGVEFFDGSCDMKPKNSVYSVPTCLPCGNGICNQFENSCNCPEDCDYRTSNKLR